MAISTLALGFYFLKSFRDFHFDHTLEELTASANMMVKHLEATASSLDPVAVHSACRNYGSASGYRFTVVNGSGDVLGDSEKDPSVMDNHADRPEIKRALYGDVGSNKRYSNSLRMDMLYVAVPFEFNGDVIGVVRTSLSLEKINKALVIMRRRLMLFAGIMTLLVILATVISTRGIRGRLTEISRHAVLLGSGDLHEKLPYSGIQEIDVLSESINRMADQLNERINTIIRQNDEQNVLFSCMIEGVLAVDNQRRLIRMNKAARKLFDVDTADLRGKSIAEIVRHADVLEIIDRTLNSSEIVEGDVALRDRNLFLQAHGSILRDKDGQKIGAILVLNDVTRLRNLEVMRKDFVANVSHELRTPITSIKGFIDTLIDKPVQNNKDREHFMQIISQQINRLQTIIDDLLALSKLEHDIENRQIDLQDARIDHILKNSVQMCSDEAEAKNIKLKIDESEKVSCKVNVQLLEQAIINLIDNAIKYSNAGTTVYVSTYYAESGLVIQVKDEGPGIPKEHISRIFERFYRVDKSRSRKLGGTGLGLAIVKHVAIAHHGRVDVTSEIGKGTVFSLYLPVT